MMCMMIFLQFWSPLLIYSLMILLHDLCRDDHSNLREKEGSIIMIIIESLSTQSWCLPFWSSSSSKASEENIKRQSKRVYAWVEKKMLFFPVHRFWQYTQHPWYLLMKHSSRCSSQVSETMNPTYGTNSCIASSFGSACFLTLTTNVKSNCLFIIPNCDEFDSKCLTRHCHCPVTGYGTPDK